MNGFARILLVIVVLLLIGFGAADYVLSGNRFTWPPPEPLSLQGIQAEIAKWTAPQSPPQNTGTPSSGTEPGNTGPEASQPPASQEPEPESHDAPSTSPEDSGGTETADSGTTTPPPVPVPACEDETPGTTAVAFVPGQDAFYCPPGTMLVARGKGAPDGNDNAPGMRFPIELAPAYSNSQVWGMGGSIGPHPNALQGDPPNYSYPWHDDFCESRSYGTQQCPSGKGHQGQDIRPAQAYDPKITTSHKLYQDHFYVVAAENGYISHVGTYMVTLYGDSGNKYDYLHMDFTPPHLLVKLGDTVKRGQPLGYVSNNFGTSVTTFHLHFEIKRPVKSGETGDGDSAWIYMSPYMALVNSYARLLKAEEPAWPNRQPPANP